VAGLASSETCDARGARRGWIEQLEPWAIGGFAVMFLIGTLLILSERRLSFSLQDDISVLRRHASFYASQESNRIQHRARFRIRQAGGFFVADVLAGRGSRWPRNRVSIVPRLLDKKYLKPSKPMRLLFGCIGRL
jgi:hypothetical protein